MAQNILYLTPSSQHNMKPYLKALPVDCRVVVVVGMWRVGVEDRWRDDCFPAA